MELLANDLDREVWLHQLDRPYQIGSPFDGEKFVCILFACDPSITTNEQNALSDMIVSANCKFACAAGHNCSSWDDSIDWAVIASKPDFSPENNDLVMTAWHEADSTSEVISFALNCTNFDGHDFKKYLVLVVGSDEVTGAEVKEAIAIEFNNRHPGQTQHTR